MITAAHAHWRLILYALIGLMCFVLHLGAFVHRQPHKPLVNVLSAVLVGFCWPLKLLYEWLCLMWLIGKLFAALGRTPRRTP